MSNNIRNKHAKELEEFRDCWDPLKGEYVIPVFPNRVTNPVIGPPVNYILPGVPHVQFDSYSKYVPNTWAHLICACSTYGVKRITSGGYNKDDLELCGTCGKLMRWLTAICPVCHEFYVIAFKHPEWTPLKSRCWDCLPEHSDAIAPPSWCVPRTKDEIAHALDKFLAFEEDLDDLTFLK